MRQWECEVTVADWKLEIISLPRNNPVDGEAPFGKLPLNNCNPSTQHVRTIRTGALLPL